jgi:hypothetical protein
VKRIAITFLVCALPLACATVESLDDRPCPCADGYTCCAALARCVPNGACPATSDAGNSPPRPGVASPDAATDGSGPSIACGDPPVAFVPSDPSGWDQRGTDLADYDVDTAPVVRFNRLATAHVKSKSPDSPTELSKFSTAATSVDLTAYRGARLRFSAVVRGAGIKGGGALWLLLTDANNDLLALDNMGDRLIKGDTDWNRYQVTLNVPITAVEGSFGVMAEGAGEVWASDPRLEVVSISQRYVPDPGAWLAGGSASEDYGIGADKSVTPCGHPTGHVAARVPTPRGDGALLQTLAADAYRGSRVQMAAYVRASRLQRGGLWLTVQDQAGNALVSDAMESRPIQGTSDWAPYSIVLDIPSSATSFFFGFRSNGTGEAWVEGLAFESVDTSVPTTN